MVSTPDTPASAACSPLRAFIPSRRSPDWPRWVQASHTPPAATGRRPRAVAGCYLPRHAGASCHALSAPGAEPAFATRERGSVRRPSGFLEKQCAHRRILREGERGLHTLSATVEAERNRVARIVGGSHGIEIRARGKLATGDRDQAVTAAGAGQVDG